MKIFILIIFINLLMCSKEPVYTLVITDVYLTDVNEDMYYSTVFLLENGSRHMQVGKYGEKGDTLTNMIFDRKYKRFVSNL